MLHDLQQSHQQDIQTITQVLEKITNRTPAQIKPLLDAMLKRLIEPQQHPFYETATPTEWSIAFQEWVDSHRTLNLPQELLNEPIIITQDGVPVMAAMSYTHLTELLETLDILTDTEFVTKLRQSITQARQGETISWENAKAKLGL